MPLSYSLGDGHDGWPEDRRDEIVSNMDKAVELYNSISEGGLHKDLTVHYVPEVPTADGNINGNIRFGHQFSVRVCLHEIAHCLGVGQLGEWKDLVVDNKWAGEKGVQVLKELDGEDAQLNADGMHFWPYGLNYENEYSEEASIKHVRVVLSLLSDLGAKLSPPTGWPGEQPVPVLQFGRWDDRYFYCTKNLDIYDQLPTWGWNHHFVAFYGWTSQQSGTVEIHAFRKSEAMFLCSADWPEYDQLKEWGWYPDSPLVAFYAFPRGAENAGALIDVIELRKGEMTHYIRADAAVKLSILRTSGWSGDRVAFAVLV